MGLIRGGHLDHLIKHISIALELFMGAIKLFEVPLNIKCSWKGILLIAQQLKQISTGGFVALFHHGGEHDTHFLISPINSLTEVTLVL